MNEYYHLFEEKYSLKTRGKIDIADRAAFSFRNIEGNDSNVFKHMGSTAINDSRSSSRLRSYGM